MLSRFRGRRGSAGSAELGIVVVSAALVLGSIFGRGIADTVVAVADGLTWLGDGTRGEAVRVNPELGRPDLRLQVADPGSDLSLYQRDDLVVVVDRTTGQVRTIDLSQLALSAAREVTPGGSVEVLLATDGAVFVADREAGTITRVELTTAATIGQPWTADDGLADVAIDGTDAVWALAADGTLTELTWSDPADRFIVEGTRALDGVGPRGVVSGHDDGVTVFGPEAGVVVQEGTGRQVAGVSADLRGEVRTAARSPHDLVPAAVASTGTVVLVTGDEVIAVDVASIGCDRPGGPEVHQGVVYVPCLGAGRVIRLGPDGGTAGAAIVTPGDGDPHLVLDDGRLFVHVPGQDRGVVVEPDGSTRVIRTADPELPATAPSAPVPTAPAPGAGAADDPGSPELPTPPSPPSAPRAPSTPPLGLDAAAPTRPPLATPPSPGQPDVAPPGVTRPDAVRPPVTIGPPSRDPWLPTDPDDPGVPGPGDPTFPDPSLPGPDVPDPSDPDPSDPDPSDPDPSDPDPSDPDPSDPDPVDPDPVDPDPEVPDPVLDVPGRPTGVAASLLRRDTSALVLRVSWDAAPSAAEVTGATVSATGSFSGGSVTRTVTGAATSADVTIPCSGSSWCDGGTATITVRVRNAAGTSPGATTSYQADPLTPPPPTLVAPTGATATANANGTVTVSWTLGTPGDEHRVVRSDTGAVVATVGGSATQAIVSPPAIAPGQTLAFRVDAVHDGQVRSSNVTAPVTAYSVPGAPPTVRVEVASRTETELVVDVTWNAAAGNGAAVTGYEVTTTTSGGSARSTSTASTSARVTLACDDFCHQESVTATVAAVNAAGTGPSASSSTTVGASPMPKGQALSVSGPSIAEDPRGGGYVQPGNATITGAAWRAFAGVCTMSVNGGPATTVPCDGGSVIIHGQPCEPWTVSVTATHSSGASVSEHHDGLVPQIPGQLCR